MSEFISVDDASKMNGDFRTIRESMLQTAYQGNDTLPICETFTKDHVQAILDDENCESLRVYLGLNESSQVCLVLVGADAGDADLLKSKVVLERGQRCPEECPPSSPLNS